MTIPEIFTYIVAPLIAAVTAVWALIAGKITPFWLKDKEDKREFGQSQEKTSLRELQNLLSVLSSEVVGTNHDLTADLINTKNTRITELRLAIIASNEELALQINSNRRLLHEIQTKQELFERSVHTHTQTLRELAGIVSELKR